MKEKEGYYNILIYYKGQEHPTIIERDTLVNSINWVLNKHNRNNFKSCDKWQIQDNKGNVIRHGKVETKIEIVML